MISQRGDLNLHRHVFELRSRSCTKDVHKELQEQAAKTDSSHAIRCSNENMERFAELIPTATMTSSKRDTDRSRMFRCPRVMGSKDPGNTARFIVPSFFKS